MIRPLAFAAGGVLALLLGLHSFYSRASAQATGSFVSLAYNANSGYMMALMSDGRVYIKPSTTWVAQGTISQGAGTFVDLEYDANGGYMTALTNDGRVFAKPGTTWVLQGTIAAGSPVTATPQSWGQVKERYR